MKVKVIFEVCTVLDVDDKSFIKMKREMNKLSTGLDLKVESVSWYPINAKSDREIQNFLEDPTGFDKEMQIEYTQVTFLEAL